MLLNESKNLWGFKKGICRCFELLGALCEKMRLIMIFA
jgi:hypothetical protein